MQSSGLSDKGKKRLTFGDWEAGPSFYDDDDEVKHPSSARKTATRSDVDSGTAKTDREEGSTTTSGRRLSAPLPSPHCHPYPPGDPYPNESPGTAMEVTDDKGESNSHSYVSISETDPAVPKLADLEVEKRRRRGGGFWCRPSDLQGSDGPSDPDQDSEEGTQGDDTD